MLKAPVEVGVMADEDPNQQEHDGTPSQMPPLKAEARSYTLFRVLDRVHDQGEQAPVGSGPGVQLLLHVQRLPVDPVCCHQ